MFFRTDWLDLLAVQGLLCTKQLGAGAVTVRVIRILLPSQTLQERAKISMRKQRAVSPRPHKSFTQSSRHPLRIHVLQVMTRRTGEVTELQAAVLSTLILSLLYLRNCTFSQSFSILDTSHISQTWEPAQALVHSLLPQSKARASVCKHPTWTSAPGSDQKCPQRTQLMAAVV